MDKERGIESKRGEIERKTDIESGKRQKEKRKKEEREREKTNRDGGSKREKEVRKKR